jgi:NADPH:quinone reductase-like Zn-dependent oxidoreductase
MKAIVQHRYGPPGALALEETGKPAAGEDDVLIRVHAAGLITLAGLIESGKVTPVIDRTYPLAEVPEAIGYFEQGHTRGKIIIAVSG